MNIGCKDEREQITTEIELGWDSKARAGLGVNVWVLAPEKARRVPSTRCKTHSKIEDHPSSKRKRRVCDG